MNEAAKARIKKYVAVYAKTDEYGTVMPDMVILDGAEYPITEAWLKPFGATKRYLITVGGKRTYLYFENPRWYVMQKVYADDKATYNQFKHPHSPDY